MKKSIFRFARPNSLTAEAALIPEENRIYDIYLPEDLPSGKQAIREFNSLEEIKEYLLNQEDCVLVIKDTASKYIAIDVLDLDWEFNNLEATKELTNKNKLIHDKLNEYNIEFNPDLPYYEFRGKFNDLINCIALIKPMLDWKDSYQVRVEYDGIDFGTPKEFLDNLKNHFRYMGEKD